MTPREKFEKVNTPFAQLYANVTRQATDLYMDASGSPRLVLEGWPFQGTFITTVHPLLSKERKGKKA